jgi:hypothetical protein
VASDLQFHSITYFAHLLTHPHRRIGELKGGRAWLGSPSWRVPSSALRTVDTTGRSPVHDILGDQRVVSWLHTREG